MGKKRDKIYVRIILSNKNFFSADNPLPQIPTKNYITLDASGAIAS